MKLQMRLVSLVLFTVIFGLGCASRVLEVKDADNMLRNEEYDKSVKITENASPVPPPAPEIKPLPAEEEKPSKRKKKKSKKTANKKEDKKKEEAPVSTKHEPDLEDAAGFVGRRPVVDPFKVGEKVVLNITYFRIKAGELTLQVKPMAEVNGEKAYHFEVLAKSNNFFNHIYGVDDTADTYMSYEKMRPFNLQISLKESKQLAEARTLFDWDKMKATYWQKRITKESGEENKKLEWDIKSYTQNIISAAFYMRTFKYEVGKQYSFRVADEGKNIVFSGEVLRKEKLDTDIGELDTIVIRPKITVDGAFAPVGEILAWLTDDDRKFLVRLESKIKIGTIVAKLKSIDKGPN